MVNLLEGDTADKIIALGRDLGWPVTRIFEADFRRDIDLFRVALQGGADVKDAVGPDECIYGEGGVDRFAVQADGIVVFLSAMHDSIYREDAKRIAVQMGFKVQ